MAKLAGVIVDEATGQRIDARVQVLASSGRFVSPADAILKVGPGVPFFYSDGAFEVDATRGPTQVLVERGTEYVPAQLSVDLPAQGTVATEIVLKRWSDLGNRGWHPGNTHIHYDEKESRPDERLRLDPRVEDLRMTAVSILKRRELEYATNKYPPGMLTEFSSAHHYVQCGEESRHNREPWAIGYGHIMLLNIRNVVEPLSRGVLVDAFDPDYPPLSYACDDAHRQGGVVIWCHNGQGMEAPVAAALGKLDAFNLFDPNWNDAEYDIYYKMLNAGLKLPASTGSDWFISSANRVYAHTGGGFEYEPWLDALKQGRTFITNGPALSIAVHGQGPGSEIEARPGERLSTLVTWQSHYPVELVEVLLNGNVVASEEFPEGAKEGHLEGEIAAQSDGWMAARLWSNARDSFYQPIFAHTSPLYLKTGRGSSERREAAAWFDDAIERSLEWVRVKGRFYTDRQRQEVVDLFREGQQVYRRMLR
ncbi:MAG: CehA/McbA family metallohydrolase [Chloroflexi bacterium]|nr:CehA/McbA family metallohydrolase [Chloroflexota bacterium]